MGLLDRGMQYFEDVIFKKTSGKSSANLTKHYLKTFLPKQHFHAGPLFVSKTSMMVADSSFQCPPKYVSSFNEPYATQYFIHVLQSEH